MKKLYRQRVVDKLLIRKLAVKGAILIEGAKWCGKTTTAEQIAKSVLYMSETGKIEQNKQLAVINPKLLLKGEKPRLIDEWQLAPTLWDSIRFEADHADELGLYILTGSSVPADMSDVIHSGTGRFEWLKMKLQQADSAVAQPEPTVVNAAVETVSKSQAKEGRVGDNLQEKTKNVQVCMPISLYKKLAMRKMDTGDTLGSQILQALNFWLNSMEK